MKTILKNFEDGFKCFLYLDAKPSPCEARHTLWLLLGYCANNFAFNTTGLFLTKYGSATLNSTSFALLLPMSTLAYSLPFMGVYREPISIFTLAGKLCSSCGL